MMEHEEGEEVEVCCVFFILSVVGCHRLRPLGQRRSQRELLGGYLTI